MDREGLIQGLSPLLKEYLSRLGFVLVEIVCRHEGSGLVLRVLADRPEGGINLDDCARLNREIGRLLDEKDVIPSRYILEVASPGLDRPLKTGEDFLRFLNKEAKFFLSEPVQEKLEWDGVINNVLEKSVFIRSGDNLIEIPFLKINKSRLIV